LISVAFGSGLVLAGTILGCHAAVGTTTTGVPCHGGGGCDLFQSCVNGFCSRGEVYLLGHSDSGRPSGFVGSDDDDGGRE
jgi:hypothetical protein